MIKARIRWCSCRVENILTLDKLLSLWLCFLLHSILFLISQTSYRTYKIISSYELARPIMGTIFLVESERSEHTVVLSLRFLSIYIYIVTKILCKIRATTFTERLWKITRVGPGAPRWDE